MKLISRIPSSVTVERLLKESTIIYRDPLLFKLDQGSFLLLDNPVIRMVRFPLIFPQATNSAFLEI